MSGARTEWPWLGSGKSVMCHLFTRERSLEAPFEAFYGPGELIGLVVAPTENEEEMGVPPDVVIFEGKAFIHYDLEMDIDDHATEESVCDVLHHHNLSPRASATVYLESSTFTATRDNVVSMKKTAP